MTPKGERRRHQSPALPPFFVAFARGRMAPASWLTGSLARPHRRRRVHGRCQARRGEAVRVVARPRREPPVNIRHHRARRPPFVRPLSERNCCYNTLFDQGRCFTNSVCEVEASKQLVTLSQYDWAHSGRGDDVMEANLG